MGRFCVAAPVSMANLKGPSPRYGRIFLSALWWQQLMLDALRSRVVDKLLELGKGEAVMVLTFVLSWL